MKFSVSRMFDVAVVASTRSFKELEKFFDYANSFFDNSVRIFQKGVSVNDNLDADFYTVQISGLAGSFQPRKRPVGIVVAQGNTTINWTIENDGSISIRTASPVTFVKIIAFYS